MPDIGAGQSLVKLKRMDAGDAEDGIYAIGLQQLGDCLATATISRHRSASSKWDFVVEITA
jgi:hypothetical protein